MLLLHHRRLFKNGRWSWNCANLSGSSDPRTSLYAIQRKICVREELHLRCLPKGPGFTDQGDTTDSRLARLLKLVRDVGLAPTLRASQARVRTGYTIPCEMVGLAGLAPAIPCIRNRCVGCYATARKSCQATGCIRSPSGHDRSLAREVTGTKIGPRGTICTRTGPVLNRMPLLLGYAG